jgi:hypothetical protein
MILEFVAATGAGVDVGWVWGSASAWGWKYTLASRWPSVQVWTWAPV